VFGVEIDADLVPGAEPVFEFGSVGEEVVVALALSGLEPFPLLELPGALRLQVEGVDEGEGTLSGESRRDATTHIKHRRQHAQTPEPQSKSPLPPKGVGDIAKAVSV